MNKSLSPRLLSTFDLRGLLLHNRVVMAPLTRARAGRERVPNDLMAEYYTQRASAGFIITVATGKYIQRMSNYCAGCRYDPAQRTGTSACPFTTLYWDFLLRHEQRLSRNQRMRMQLNNLARLTQADRLAIREQSRNIRDKYLSQ